MRVRGKVEELIIYVLRVVDAVWTGVWVIAVPVIEKIT